MYKELQNGSDVRGIALDGVAGEKVNLTKDAVVCISRAFIRWLKKKTGKEEVKAAVGRDSRISGPDILKWAADGMAAEGAKVYDFGLASTPAMFMSTVIGDVQPDGSVMVTASHLPFNKNGLKFFTSGGGLEKEDIAAILADAGTLSPVVQEAAPEKTEFMKTYSAHLCEKIKKDVGAEDFAHPLSGYHVVVDAGNGAGGFFAEEVLKPLGADITGSRFLKPDGNFPNHIPNPENREAMESIREAVLESKADLGLIFDTDVDRAGAVLPDGRELNRNALIALISAIVLRDHPGTTIVTDSVTSTGLAEFIKSHGGIHRRFKRGYRNVINESIRLNGEGINSELAMETSGHGALMENYFMDDGAYLSIKMLIELGKGNRLEDLIRGLKEPAESREVRFRFQDPGHFREDGQKVLKAITEEAAGTEGWSIAPENFEGVRVNADREHGNGWFLLRMSLHEPLMPLNIESDEHGGILKIAEKLLPLIKKQPCLDAEPLENLVFAKP